jgi:hypothetical protein
MLLFLIAQRKWFLKSCCHTSLLDPLSSGASVTPTSQACVFPDHSYALLSITYNTASEEHMFGHVTNASVAWMFEAYIFLLVYFTYNCNKDYPSTHKTYAKMMLVISKLLEFVKFLMLIACILKLGIYGTGCKQSAVSKSWYMCVYIKQVL